MKNPPQIRLSVGRLADLDAAIPGLAGVWRAIKARIETTIRVPKSLVLRESAEPMQLSDNGESGRRYALDLRTMTLGDVERRVSGGEWACHAGSNNDSGVTGVPSSAAMVEVRWHEYYRYASLDVQVAPGVLARQLPNHRTTAPPSALSCGAG